jgi:hypothetical protein
MIHSRDLVRDGKLELGVLLLSAVMLGACSTQTSGVGSSHPPDVGGSANSAATSTEASAPPSTQPSASTSPSTAPPLQPTTSAPSPGMDGPTSQALVDGAVLTPELLAAELCKKLPACANLICPSNQVPLQRAVCKPNNVPVCECTVMQTGR